MSDGRFVLVAAHGLRMGRGVADRRAQDDSHRAGTMTKEPTFEEQELLAETQRCAAVGMQRRELRVELGIDVAFLVSVAVLFLLPSPQPLDPLAAVLSVGVMVLAMQVSFETPFGFTVASQLAYVPMLFCIPVAYVPLVMVGIMFAQTLPGVVSGEVPRTRLLRSMANAWFAVGPSLVFAIADVRPDAAGPFILLAALAAQFVTDWIPACVFFARRFA